MASNEASIPRIQVPQHLPFDQLLVRVSEGLTGEAFARTKRSFRGEIGNDLDEDITDPWNLLRLLNERNYITEDNVILLQRLVYNIKNNIRLRSELLHSIITYARQRQTLYVEDSPPQTLAEEGVDLIHFHININLPRRLINVDTSLLKNDVARIFGVDPRKVSLKIPTECAEMIPDLIELGLHGHFTADVDKIAIGSHMYDVKEEHKPSNRMVHRAEYIPKWDDAINERDEDAIAALLKAENLPNSDQIRHACEVFGRGSGAVSRICLDVSNWIKSQDDNIVRVEPAYESTCDGDVTFIIYLRQHENDLNYDDLRFKVLVRIIGQYNLEGKGIVDEEVKKHLKFTSEDANTLSKCLEKHSKPLMEKHSNLQMISASHFKSKNYGNENLDETMCVVFYVRVKGFIPLTEERLPTNLDGIPTDIREGGFEFLSKAKDVHTHLKIGCEIAGAGKENFSGTLGPFLKYDGFIYCLTAAHVLYGIPKDGEAEYDWPSMKSCGKKVDVFQPNPNNLMLKTQPFGCVYSAKFKQGGMDASGIDVAVIHVESRQPISGEFPEAEEGSYMEEEDDNDGNGVHKLAYNTGEICERDFITDNNEVKVLKFGSETGETRGQLRLAGTSVKFDDCRNSQGVLLYNQIEIRQNNLADRIFADNGDSGAVILVDHGGNGHDLKALALLIGRSTTGTVIGTPMYAIFDELKLPNRNFMTFQERNVNSSISVDSAGLGKTALPMAAAIQTDLEDNYIQSRLESMEKTLKTTISSEFKGFADQMIQMLNQRLPQNQIGNASDNTQNSGD